MNHSYTEELSSIYEKSNNEQGQKRLKRGTTTQYMIENTPLEIVNNTLSGLLIKFLRENGPQPIDVLQKLLTSEYTKIRKLSGHLYNGNMNKALKGALTANGLFEMITLSDQEVESPSGEQTIAWKIVEEAAEKYIVEKVKQVTEQRNKVLRKQKLTQNLQKCSKNIKN